MKRTLLLIILLITTCVGYSQSKEGYIYKIKLQSVDDFRSAKMIAYVLEQKFQYFPSFNDSTDRFEFYSPLKIEESDFKTLITSKSYELLGFERLACVGCEIKEQE